MDETLDAATLLPGRQAARAAAARAVRLVLLAHLDPDRVGATAPVAGRLELSRAAPAFSDGQPMRDRFVSRAPVVLEPAGALGLTVSARDTRTAVTVDGLRVKGAVTLSPERLDAGVVIELGPNVAALLERTGPIPQPRAGAKLLGVSAGLMGVRQAVGQVADLEVPVLIRGPSGAGKELVARALHAHSPRAAQPFAAVNMGAIAPNLAASELFGHARGAFSGAASARDGLFVEADGGTLFLDEIGECPPEVQAALLRTLETGEVRPVGGSPRRVDVRLVAATDADLEAAVAGGTFKSPLLHRLAGFVVQVPPLNARRADIGVLAYHFAAAALAQVGRPDALRADPPFLPAPVVAGLARRDWAGNVRGLRNAIQQLVIQHRHAPQVVAEAPAPALAPEPTPAPPKPQYRKASQVSDAELVQALRAHGFALKATAAALNISRTSLYGLIDKSATLRKAADVGEAELRAVSAACEGKVDRMATQLEVSPSGLKARLRALGIG